MRQILDIKQVINYYRQAVFHVLRVQRNVVAPGSKYFGAKTPPAYGLLIPLCGRANMHFDKVLYEMEPGKIFHFTPNMQLDKEVIGQEYWDYIVIQYHREDNIPLLQYADSHYESDISFTPHLYDLLLQIYMQCSIPGQFTNQKAQALLANIWVEILPKNLDTDNEKSRLLIQEAIKFIDLHYTKNLTIPAIAENYGLGCKQFTYLFRKFKGISPNQYIISLRIQRAQELLYRHQYSIAEVSHCVGYTDPYYFSRLFKKRTGQTPGACKKSVPLRTCHEL
ncbi:AraC-type DNA-binding protein [Propionispira arboris]|uniref:AraC-type DNA-binding protein n=1 Tax=Propionispira arboris TaxID=84035 RepID=A0A1H7D2G6_9FIRM|nr:AraC family transcriptional regulator [Propionispira arboris]SEJ93682.1 AraC-type DNA-binding protein [Propionispira arboris]